MPEVGEITDAAFADPFVPSFARDLRPLFRPLDIEMMIVVRNLDLSSHAAVSEHAQTTLSRLSDGTMSCDGPWPQSELDVFRACIEAGKQP